MRHYALDNLSGTKLGTGKILGTLPSFNIDKVDGTCSRINERVSIYKSLLACETD